MMEASSEIFIRPHRLHPGDTIGIVSPASPFNPEAFQSGVGKLERLGFRVKYSQAIFSQYHFLTSEDKQRAEQINGMFADKTVKAIFCANGGYGSIRTIPHLDAEIIHNNPKIFVGYSDITILLVYLLSTTQMVVFHGPVISGEINEKINPLTLDYLLRAITGTAATGALRLASLKALRAGKVTGILVGGNASLLTRSLGTPYEINTANRILFLEDNCDDFEEIDSQLIHLRMADKFKQVKGIIFGELVTWAARERKRKVLQEILKDILQDLKVPVVYGFPSGHIKPGEANITLPLGVPVTINADEPEIIMEESGVI